MDRRIARCLLVAAAAVSVVACAPPPRPADGVPETQVSVTDGACRPNAIEVKAGRNRFVITNASMRPLEWEILDGVMVVDERENIAPGFVQTLTTTLRPGTYVMTCGLLTNPRGTLTVVADPEAAAAAPTPLAFVAAQAEYKVYLHDRGKAMLAQVAAFADLLRAGDLAAAQAGYAASREAWQQLAPVAPMLAAPYDRLEGQPSLYAGGETDPGFVGWHRIERALFAGGTPAPAQLAALADALQADATAFVDGINAAKIGPGRILAGAATSATRIAERKLRGEDNPFAGSDLADARANVAGLRRVTELFARALAEHAPGRLQAMQGRLDALERGLAEAGRSGAVDPALADEAGALAGEFSAGAAQLGL